MAQKQTAKSATPATPKPAGGKKGRKKLNWKTRTAGLIRVVMDGAMASPLTKESKEDFASYANAMLQMMATVPEDFDYIAKPVRRQFNVGDMVRIVNDKDGLLAMQFGETTGQFRVEKVTKKVVAVKRLLDNRVCVASKSSFTLV